MRSLCIKVPKREAEKVRKKLLEKELMRRDLKIRRNDYVYFPVIRKEDMEFEFVVKEFKPLPKKGDYKSLVPIPKKFYAALPSSFDVIGDIAVLKITQGLLRFRKKIGKALIRAHPNLKVVCLDRGVRGEQRIRDLEVIAGEPRTETIHKEYGIKLMVDLAKVYFSPRLAGEHWRVAKKVKKGEFIVDMFAGVGPFSILIAKYSNPKRVISMDLNPNAIRYLNKNVEINKVRGIDVWQGDAKELIGNVDKLDRVIMNLPSSAYKFFKDAYNVVRPGGMLHYYEILRKNRVESRIADLNDIANYRIKTSWRVIKTYSPSAIVAGIDVLKVK